MTALRRRPHPGRRRRRPSVAASAVALFCLAVAGGSSAADASPLRGGPGSPGSLTAPRGGNAPVRPTPPDVDQYAQWKTKRRWRGRTMGQKDEWEDDDDDEGAFHLSGDYSAAANVNEAQTAISPTGAASEEQAEKKPVEDNAKQPDNNEKGEQQSHKEDEGIIYSDTVGPKESDPLPPRPPDGADNMEGKDDQIDAANEEKTHSGTGHTKQHARSKADDGDEDGMPADTIFDDLLRGFAFAAFFCLAIVCLYKCCWYTCVRCGIFPDERVLEARWRRWQLRKKRSYRNATTGSPRGDIPPLDTRQWGKWMADHDADGEDGHYYSTNRDEDGVWDDEDHSVGGIDFDDDGDLVEMAAWHEGDATSEMELEYGEDVELEDESHDARLFDEEDAGEGVQKEASKFFGKKKSAESKAKENRRGSAGTEVSSTKSNEPTPGAGAENGETNVSDDHFFDALQKSNGKKDDCAVALGLGSHENGGDEPSSAENDAIRVDEIDDANDEGFPSSMLAEEAERGYDEETDLLGLRSDSPPPLDLAEIEKGLVEQMEQAKFY